MPLEAGGRADKAGNRYEIKCIIYELLKVISEDNYSVVIEALGDDEIGTDILVTNFQGMKEHQQCKARNASRKEWSISDLKARDILKNWKKHLERDAKRQVAVVSAIGCNNIVDLHDRAMNTNENPYDFYKYQIKESSSVFCKFYEDFCAGMGLVSTEESNIAKSIDFLRRIKFKQMSEYALREIIFQGIERFFLSDKEVVYNSFIALIVDGDIWGKEITASVLFEYFSKQNVVMRLMDGDKRITPQINVINQKYRDSFKALKEGLIARDEFQKCIDVIRSEQSFIISGNAGYGKSGCTEAILNYCEKEKIPYIALKLDRKIPRGNCKSWGKELGFPGSISYALHAVSKDKPAVIVLDQLDALRWTQANSSEALSVCMELIRQVRYLNCERKKKMIIVFVCREYDLHNDNNISSLFKKENDNVHQEEWQKIIVKEFDETIVKRVIGDKYDRLTLKTRRLLQIPSNLYIWQHLDEDEIYDDCTTTSHLIEIWFRQICKKSNDVGVEEKVVRDTLDCIVKMLDKIGRLYVPKRILEVEERGFDYLISAELVAIDGNRVGFVHQSILDYFISKRMMQQYYENENIEKIIGDKNKQTPSKRYQIQMFLQNLLEYDSLDFLSAGKKMLKSEQVRYYVKYVFYEILGQISEPDEQIAEFIRKGCKDEKWRDYLLNNVVCGKRPYVTILRDCGLLEEWFSDEKKKSAVFILFRSISPNLDIQDIEFIKRHSFIDEEDDKQFSGCFLHDITQESDALFELRMLFYDKYPIWAQELYIDIKSMMKYCESRTIRLISFWLRNKITSNGKNVYRYEEELVDESDSYLLNNGKYVLDELLQYIPKENSWEVRYSDWSGRYFHKRGLERAAVCLIKKANKAIISKNPEVYWEYYKPYMGKNYIIFNEIILHGFQFLPSSYSNSVIKYLASDLEKNIFDYTSGANDELGLVKNTIRIHTISCNKEILELFVNTVEKYVSSRAVEWYKRRIELNKSKEYEPVYWSFWGDLQYELLQCVPCERLSQKDRNLLDVLERKFSGKADRYISGNGHSGWVSSPVSAKRIGKNQWLQIITNKKLGNRRNSNWKEVEGGFVESSIEMYSSDFQTAVKNDPEEMIKLVIEHKDDVVPVYINSMYFGVEFSEHMDQIEQQLLEGMFREFPCDMESQRASCFCGIIEKAKINLWSTDVIKQLKEIALKYKGIESIQKTKDNAELNCEELISRSLNCVRGNAVRAIGHLLWENKELYEEFKKIIDVLSSDKDSAIRMATLYALWPVYNIDREWAETRILSLYESDVRMAGFQDSRGMFHRLYFKYREHILPLIKNCFETEDKRLIQLGGHSVCEFFMRYNEFEEIVSNIEQLSEEQIKAILHMAVIYLEYDEYREKSKKIILKCKNSDSDVEYSFGRIFYDKYVDLERDSDFLIDIMKSNVSKRLVYSFTHFLEENACSIKEYTEVIITLCENVLSMPQEAITKQWGIENDISKLIIALYDETSNSDSDAEKKIAEKCLELWDVMFEKQIGEVRNLSRKLMER